MGPDQIELSMVKGEHRFIFRYPVGYEDLARRAITEAAEDGSKGLDLDDAAVLHFQLKRRSGLVG